MPKHVLVTILLLMSTLIECGQTAPDKCRGINDGCCTHETPCESGDGDCDGDEECMLGLVCGTDNCPESFGTGDDCCEPFEVKAGRCKGQDNGCCTPRRPCDAGDGDCDSDLDCYGTLKCGSNNCGDLDDIGDDCCYQPRNMFKPPLVRG